MTPNEPTLVDTSRAGFTLREQHRYSSSWMVRVQVSGKKLVKSNYRNDPVKYDLNFFFLIEAQFKWSSNDKMDDISIPRSFDRFNTSTSGRFPTELLSIHIRFSPSVFLIRYDSHIPF